MATEQQNETEEKRGRGRPATGATPPRSIKIPDEEWQAWKIAAESDGAASLTEWIRGILNKAAKRKRR